MNPKDKLSKSSWSLRNSMLDVTISNIHKAVQNNQLKIEQKQLDILLSLIPTSMDEGYHRAHRSFVASVEDVVKEVSRDAVEEYQKKSSA